MKRPSTESQARKAQAVRSSPGTGRKLPAAQHGPIRVTAWQWTAVAILAGAALLRLLSLTVKPLHHDEGVNGQFLTNLFRTGYYHYDPANFHGPTLYYIACITTAFNTLFFGKAGLSTFAIRLVPALFGVGIVWLVLSLRRELGSVGSLVAAALAAVSSGFVYYSRYFIHEILFVFFSLSVVICVLRFRQTSRTRYLMLAALSAALMGTTKETWVITVAVWLIALPCTRIYLRLRRPGLLKPAPAKEHKVKASIEKTEAPTWDQKPALLYGATAMLFVVVWVVLYSSFFTNFPKGIYDSFVTYGYWFKTSESAHVYGQFKYLDWIWREDWPALVLGIAGILIAFWEARSSFLIFCAFWSMGILAAYSLIEYKTPWIVLNILLPFILMAGYALDWFYRVGKRITPGFFAAVTVLFATVAVGASLYRAIDLSFDHYDDDTQAYVYAHTRRDFLSLVNDIDTLAAANPAGKDVGIVVMSPEHWPLPWYLRNYTHVGYWGKVIDTNEPILVVHEKQVAEVEQKLGARYRRYSEHELRPGNVLYLYVRRDLSGG